MASVSSDPHASSPEAGSVFLYESILENLRDGVLAVDLKGRIQTFNPAAEELFGLRREEVVGEAFAGVFLELEGTDAFVQAVLDAVYEAETIHHARTEYPGPEGPRTLAVTTTFLEGALPSGESERLGVIAVVSDVTALEELQKSRAATATLRAEALVRAFREHGHLAAALDPLSELPPAPPAVLTPSHHGLDEEDTDTRYSVALGSGVCELTLAELVAELRACYCGALGAQYAHVDDPEARAWLRLGLEDPAARELPPREKQLRILRKLTEAEVFEAFLQRNFQRAKRFSLEGGETLIPLLDQAIEAAAQAGVERVVIGMSHRGRLNVLVNLLGVPVADILRRFARFEADDGGAGKGDVSFHLGASGRRRASCGREVGLDLCFNPSHLEFVAPVVLGRARALAEGRGDPCSGAVLPVILHGDAAFAGQGIVQETLNLGGLAAYGVGGAIHVVVNNQIGFTTSPDQGRATRYATDVGRMLQVPILHVNGERPEAVDRAIRLATAFRARFRRDVVLDLFCFRRRGHMELDDPTMTQPALYSRIAERPLLRETYARNLVALGQITEAEATAEVDCAREALEGALGALEVEVASLPRAPEQGPEPQPEPARAPRVDPASATALLPERLRELLEALGTAPGGFDLHPKVAAVLRGRRAMASGKRPVTWAAGEMLAYASLAAEGVPVRLTGQDSERGTFGHRHAVLHDQQTGERYRPLDGLGAEGARAQIHNSPLSEAAVLAFEFGYSLETTPGLVIWEAQFGDFANGAQVVIDQFVVSCQEKWGLRSGLCLLLPHGLEGGGPEHSSARPERFLQLAAGENLEVVFLSTAAQVFHRLRAQARVPGPPLVVFSPKRALQLPAASSPLATLSAGSFEPLLVDHPAAPPDRVLLCAGPLGAELVAQRERRGVAATVVRVERLHPFPEDALAATLAELPGDLPVVWVQQEPANMGAASWVLGKLSRLAPGRRVDLVARPRRANPAVGSGAAHEREARAILDRALGPIP
jgi:2-oxoglutarate dehydrogenase E1 component